MTIRLSTKGRYGLRAMVDLAKHYGEGPVLVRAIAEDEAISGKYLHSLLSVLKTAGFVRSVRGSGGGFVLAKPPAEISVQGVLEALEGPLAVVDCVLDESLCDRADTCSTRGLWQTLNQAMVETLAGVTLDQLVRKPTGEDGDHRDPASPVGRSGSGTKLGPTKPA